METKDTIALSQQYLMSVYKPLPVAFVRGQGCRLWDAEGNQYLDFVAGIAVAGLGHCHPQLVAAITQQTNELMHTSNLYYIPPQAQLAQRLAQLSFGDRCFFANSGAEANEAAIKLARRWAGKHRTQDCRDIITAHQSFHGRTLATIAATGQDKYQKPFHPLPPGFKYVPFNDVPALEKAVDARTCAVMLEPIQAEGGINVPDHDYLPTVRELCDERGILLILDEVQTGLGRTGRWFGYQHTNIQPDVMTLAKSLGGSFPIGACIACEDVATAFQPGDHASTFGGNHLACAAALATLEIIQTEGLVENAARMGAILTQMLHDQLGPTGLLDHVRGKGLLLAVQLADSILAQKIERQCLSAGLVVNALAEHTIRLVPPLIVTEDECSQAVQILREALIEAAGHQQRNEKHEFTNKTDCC